MYKLYSNINTHDTILECWGASTKHPDSKNSYFDSIEKDRFTPSEYASIEMNVFQWLLYLASDKTWWFHARDLAQYANDIYDVL